MIFNVFAGIPPAITFDGIFFVTTELFAMMLLSPISTPFSIFTLDPIQTFFPIITLPVFADPIFRSSGDAG